MSRVRQLGYGAMMVCICANFSSQESDSSKEKPKVNFYGTLVDNSGTEYTVENILIGNLYKSIPVYTQPQNAALDPQQDSSFLDLNEVAEITTTLPANPTATEPQVTYAGRPYHQIQVILKDSKKTTTPYIVEVSRKLTCDVPNEAGAIKKQLSFSGFKKITITGSRKQEKEEIEPKSTTIAKANERNRQCQEVGKALHQLEEETEKINDANRGNISELVQSVKNWVGGLCSS